MEFGFLFKVIASLEEKRSKSALITRRTIFGCIASPDIKNGDIAKLFEKKKFKGGSRLEEVREVRKSILKGQPHSDFARDLYDGTPWYDAEIRNICRKWFAEPGVTDWDSGGDKVWVDVDGNGEQVFRQCRVVSSTTPQLNHAKFAAHDSYGGECKRLCGRIPSSDILHSEMPRDVGFFSKIRPGVHETKLVLRLNTITLSKFLIEHGLNDLAANLNDDPMVWTKDHICDPDGEKFHACIEGDCWDCNYSDYFVVEEEDHTCNTPYQTF